MSSEPGYKTITWFRLANQKDGKIGWNMRFLTDLLIYVEET